MNNLQSKFKQFHNENKKKLNTVQRQAKQIRKSENKQSAYCYHNTATVSYARRVKQSLDIATHRFTS